MREPTDASKTVRALTELRQEHRDLDVAIARLVADPTTDELAIKRLKKRKLQIKDAVSRLESALIPDLDA
ncbi:MAG: YdcH family protein [Xanthomonadaceae bacterium]|jgi:hypothetical protein|nr:YdcH family protein [Xanthomonadaceae bacterium]MDP2186883.1 YdcH family protein [Xanthomonadales bacterium]MDZ4114912.1 YdcH family protein [Xanthomonadaceae bacterium]MDZ4377470.1 YdcH family protein [Xanthomonadaceae bacterium]